MDGGDASASSEGVQGLSLGVDRESSPRSPHGMRRAAAPRSDSQTVRGDPSSRPFPHDRPRERLARFGSAALSEAELLALILRTGGRGNDAVGVAREVLERCGGLNALVTTPLNVLERVPGLGPAKSASLSALDEIATRLRSAPLVLGEPIRSPVDVHRHFQSGLAARRRESFHVLLLDGRHRLIRVEEISTGTLSASLVHPREVFRGAIRSAAAALVLVHNHPSGDPMPSAEDRAVTTRLREAGEVIGIPVVDHVIVAEGGHYSFREAREGGSWDETASRITRPRADRQDE